MKTRFLPPSPQVLITVETPSVAGFYRLVDGKKRLTINPEEGKRYSSKEIAQIVIDAMSKAYPKWGFGTTTIVKERS